MPARPKHRRAEHLRDMAWECRMLAGAATDPETRLDLFLLAQRFERLAEMSLWSPGLLEAKPPLRLHQRRR